MDYICHENPITSTSLPNAWTQFVFNLNSILREFQFTQPTFYLLHVLQEAIQVIEKCSFKVFEQLGFKVTLVLFHIKHKTSEIQGQEVYDPEENYYFIDSHLLQNDKKKLVKLLDYARVKQLT